MHVGTWKVKILFDSKYRCPDMREQKNNKFDILIAVSSILYDSKEEHVWGKYRLKVRKSMKRNVGGYNFKIGIIHNISSISTHNTYSHFILLSYTDILSIYHSIQFIVFLLSPSDNVSTFILGKNAYIFCCES